MAAPWWARVTVGTMFYGPRFADVTEGTLAAAGVPSLCDNGGGGSGNLGVDQQYSVMAISNAAGEVVERRQYGPYGEIEVNEEGVPPVELSVGYTGREWDADVGMYYFRARWYSPKMGRFVNRDPLTYVDGMNLYRGYFVPGKVDPAGLKECAPVKAVADAVLGQANGLFNMMAMGEIRNAAARKVLQDMGAASRESFVNMAPVEILSNIASGLPGVTPIGIMKDKIKDVVIDHAKGLAEKKVDPNKPFSVVGGLVRDSDECDCYYTISFSNGHTGATVVLDVKVNASEKLSAWSYYNFTFKGTIKSAVVSIVDRNSGDVSDEQDVALSKTYADIEGKYK